MTEKQKIGITVDNKNYIVKFAKNGSCSVYTEYIASRFIFNATNIDIDKNLIRFYRFIVILRYLVIIERYDFDKAYNKALRLVGA